MHRFLYLSTLLLVQWAFLLKLAAPIGQALRIDLSPGLAPVGWPALLQLLATAAAVAGIALVLLFPSVALVRHWHDGSAGFASLPRWPVAVAVLGAASLLGGTVLAWLAPMLSIGATMTATLVARPVVGGGLALAAAGVLVAELLRRPAATAAGVRMRAGRVEVTYPPELRTRAR